MKRLLRALGIVAIVASASVVGSPSRPALADSIPVLAAQGQIQPAVINTGVVQRVAPFLSDGLLNSAQDMKQEEADAASGSGGAGVAITSPTSSSPGSLGCSGRSSNGDARVNQDCTFRRQAEEIIKFNPADTTNFVAGQNDSSLGFNQCGFDWSTDSGRHWGSGIPPFRQKINNPPAEALPVAGDNNRHTINGAPGTNHTYDFGSDPALAFDSQGRAFFSCLALDINDNAALLYVTASPPGAEGSFYFNIPSSSRAFVVAEDNDATVTHDKEFIVADTFASSPNRDNVYVTWTVFRFTGVSYTESPIYGSMSTNHGRIWSTPEEISGSNTSLCFFGNIFGAPESPNACDFDQGSDPIVLPNGDLEVIFNNGNTAANNPNSQQLGVHCKPSGSSPAGTAHLNCGPPTKVGDDVTVGEPQCSFGRECIPGAFIRTNDFPRIAVNRGTGILYATWQDYRNQEFDIQFTQSSDGGITWVPSVTVNPDRGLDHYFPAVDVKAGSSPDRVGVSYFRTERVPNENTNTTFNEGSQPGVGTGNSDYVLAGGTALQVPYTYKVVSPVFPPPDGNQTGFNGDYSGLIIPDGSANAQPIWSDTRNINPYPENGSIHDEDVFTDNVGLPNGQATVFIGTIGK